MFFIITHCLSLVCVSGESGAVYGSATNSVILANSFYLFGSQLFMYKLTEAKLVKVHKQMNQAASGKWAFEVSEV